MWYALILTAFVLWLFGAPEVEARNFQIGQVLSSRVVFCTKVEDAKKIMELAQAGKHQDALDYFDKTEGCNSAQATFQLVRIIATYKMPDGDVETIVEIDVGAGTPLYSITSSDITDPNGA